MFDVIQDFAGTFAVVFGDAAAELIGGLRCGKFLPVRILNLARFFMLNANSLSANDLVVILAVLKHS